jgi:hypothetical protein
MVNVSTSPASIRPYWWTPRRQASYALNLWPQAERPPLVRRPTPCRGNKDLRPARAETKAGLIRFYSAPPSVGGIGGHGKRGLYLGQGNAPCKAYSTS